MYMKIEEEEAAERDSTGVDGTCIWVQVHESMVPQSVEELCYRKERCSGLGTAEERKNAFLVFLVHLAN